MSAENFSAYVRQKGRHAGCRTFHGGYGAWKLALGASDTFGAGASLSGALDIVDDYKRHMALADGRKPLFEGIFGSLENLREAIMRFCPSLKSLRKKRAEKSFRRCMPGVERRTFCMKEI